MPHTIRTMVKAIAALVLPVPALLLLYANAPVDPRSDYISTAPLAFGLLALVSTMVVSVWQLTRSKFPMLAAASAIVFTIPMVLVAFAYTYVVIGAQTPTNFSESLTKVDSFYFTLSTFATVGFGDIAATSQKARAIVSLQIAIDLAVLGALLKFYISTARKQRRTSGSDS